MTVTTPEKLNADAITLTLSDGVKTVQFDVKGEMDSFLFPMGAHTTDKWISQNIKQNTMTKDGTYEAITVTHTFALADYETIEGWWKSTTEDLTYSVSGGPFSTAKTYANCHVRVTSGPALVPGSNQYQTVSLEITCLAPVTGT